MSMYPNMLLRIGHNLSARLEQRIGTERWHLQKRIWQYERELVNAPGVHRARLRALWQRAHNVRDVLQQRQQRVIRKLHIVAVKIKCVFGQVVVPDFRPSGFKVITASISRRLGALHHKVRTFPATLH